MLVIRLQRTGRRNAPAYRLVVAEKSKPVQGKYLEILGHYLPTRNPAEFEFNTDSVEAWIKKGAQPSDTAARLLTKAGVKNLDKFMFSYTKKRKRNAPAEEAAPPPPPPSPVEEKKEETPAEEPKEEPKVETPAEEAKVEKKEEAPVEEPKEEAKEIPAEEPKEDASKEVSEKEGDS